jgi:replicative DNA helicase
MPTLMGMGRPLPGKVKFMSSKGQARSRKTMHASSCPAGLECYDWDKLGQDLNHVRSGYKTGYKALDEYVRIPRGAMTVVAGRPAHGKTSFLLNLLVNMLRHKDNKDLRFYFFSYEEAKKYIATKLIMIMAGEVLDDKKNLGAYTKYLNNCSKENKKRGKAAINKAINEFNSYTNSEYQRLFIIDHPYKGKALATLINTIGQNEQTGAVFIDYIQKIPIENVYRLTARYLEVKIVSELLLNSAKTGDIPLIVGAQLGRKASQTGELTLYSLRESGDLEQDANVVLGLYYEALEDKAGSHHNPGPVNLQVQILKNRGGPGGKKVILEFDGRVFQVSERKGFF